MLSPWGLRVFLSGPRFESLKHFQSIPGCTSDSSGMSAMDKASLQVQVVGGLTVCSRA